MNFFMTARRRSFRKDNRFGGFAGGPFRFFSKKGRRSVPQLPACGAADVRREWSGVSRVREGLGEGISGKEKRKKKVPKRFGTFLRYGRDSNSRPPA